MRQKRSWYIPGKKEARPVWSWVSKQDGVEGDPGEFCDSDQGTVAE